MPATFIVLLFASCTRPNPDFCCVTAETCAAAGLGDERRPCEVGQACKSYGCVAAECSSSADCASSDAPTCLDGLCVAGCAVDDDCAGVAGQPRCDASDATCVGCLSNDQCSADRAICDADTRSCRGCTADDQCASGVCIEADGTCAADDAIIYVSDSGQDAGTCAKAAPCATMSFAIGLTTSVRYVIKILGGQFYLGSSTISLSGSVIIDGSDTALISGSSPVFSLIDDGTLEGVRLSSPNAFTPLITVSTGGALRMARAIIERGEIRVKVGGSLKMSDVALRDGNLDCENGSLTMNRIHLDRGYLDTNNCMLGISSSRLEPTQGGLANIRFGGGLLKIENNVFIGTDATSSLIFILGFSPGSTFRFNTIVNTSPTSGSQFAVLCSDGLDVTSNIFAYNSTSPISCEARYSLFDVPGAQEVGRGTGNASADVGTIFKSLASGDLHLTANSPARGLGEPGLVTADLDGNARPMPVGSMPDVGAYEVP